MNNNEMILSEHQTLINQAMQEAFADTIWQIKKPLTQGASAAIYLIETTEKYLLARFSDPNRPAINIPLEYSCMQQAARHQLAPTVFYCNEKNGLSIMEFIKTQSLPFILHNPQHQHIELLGNTLATLHKLNLFPASHSIFNLLTMLEKGLSATFFDDNYLSKCAEIITRYQPLLNIDEDIRPAHRDLHAFNVLFNGKQFYLIDWEGAGNESLYFDLAITSNNLLLTKDKDNEILLTSYFKQKPSRKQWAKFKLMQIVGHIYYGFILMYLSMSINEKKLSLEEIATLPDYIYFIQQQVKANNANLAGTYLKLGYANLKAALEKQQSTDIQSYEKSLSFES